MRALSFLKKAYHGNPYASNFLVLFSVRFVFSDFDSVLFLDFSVFKMTFSFSVLFGFLSFLRFSFHYYISFSFSPNFCILFF